MLKIINNHKHNLEDFESDILRVFALTVKKVTKDVTNELSAGLLFATRKEIRDLNKRYRSKDEATDVLSFPCDAPFVHDYLGDVVVCYPVAKKQAKAYQHSLRRELCFLFLHGLLHLAGYDHIDKQEEEVMFALQKLILDELAIKRELAPAKAVSQ